MTNLTADLIHLTIDAPAGGLSQTVARMTPPPPAREIEWRDYCRVMAAGPTLAAALEELTAAVAENDMGREAQERQEKALTAAVAQLEAVGIHYPF